MEKRVTGFDNSSSTTNLEDIRRPLLEGRSLVVQVVATGHLVDSDSTCKTHQVVQILSEGAVVLVVARTEGEHREAE